MNLVVLVSVLLAAMIRRYDIVVQCGSVHMLGRAVYSTGGGDVVLCQER